MAADVELRTYRQDDLRAMFEMDVLCFAEPFRFDLRSMRRFAEAQNAMVVVAERATGDLATQRLLGFVILHMEGARDARLGYIVTLDVLPEARRTGVAGRLMTEIEGRAADAGAQEIDLHVFAGNEGAIRFYERIGYSPIGTHRRFYGIAEGVSLDALVYRKRLGTL